MKKLFTATVPTLSLSVLSLSILLTACGGNNSTKESTDTTKKESENQTTLNAKASKDTDTNTLTIYSYDSFTSEWGPAPKLKEAFEKDCACTLEFVPFEDGVTMFNRLRLEGDQPKADVIIGLDNNLLKEAEKSELFAKTDLDLSGLKLPVESVSEWTSQTFIPYDYGQYSFIYNKENLANPPKSLKELVENQDIAVIYQDPRTSTVGRGLLAWMNNVYGDDAGQAWNTLAQHTVTVGKGWSESYGAFLKGESDMVLSYNTSPLYHQINEDKDNYVSAEFSEGHIVQIELASRLKNTDSPKLAEDFLAFLISPEAQKTIALSNIMLPVIETEVEPRFDSFTPYKTLEVPTPEDKVSKEQIKVWLESVSN